MRICSSTFQVFAAIVFGSSLSQFNLGQSTNDTSDLESWNDVELTYMINQSFDINTIITARLDEKVTRFGSRRFTMGVTAKPATSFSISPFITFISGRDSHGNFRYEYRTGIGARYRFPFRSVNLTHRSQIEHRSRPGNNSWRYRPSIRLEKQIPESLSKGTSVFLVEEPFYDSASGRFSRNRLSIGIGKDLSERSKLEVYYLFQGDDHSTPGSVHVLGTALKIRL